MFASVRSTGPELLTNAEKQVSTLVRRALSACVVVRVAVSVMSLSIVVVVVFLLITESVVVFRVFGVITISSVCSPNFLGPAWLLLNLSFH